MAQRTEMSTEDALPLWQNFYDTHRQKVQCHPSLESNYDEKALVSAYHEWVADRKRYLTCDAICPLTFPLLALDHLKNAGFPESIEQVLVAGDQDSPPSQVPDAEPMTTFTSEDPLDSERTHGFSSTEPMAPSSAVPGCREPAHQDGEARVPSTRNSMTPEPSSSSASSSSPLPRPTQIDGVTQLFDTQYSHMADAWPNLDTQTQIQDESAPSAQQIKRSPTIQTRLNFPSYFTKTPARQMPTRAGSQPHTHAKSFNQTKLRFPPVILDSSTEDEDAMETPPDLMHPPRLTRNSTPTNVPNNHSAYQLRQLWHSLKSWTSVTTTRGICQRSGWER